MQINYKASHKSLLALILTLGINLNILQAADFVGSGFSYQGELLDSGSPANTQYDILFKAFDAVEDGDQNPIEPEFFNVQVTNGLFNIENIDFGSETYAGKEVFLEVNVRKSVDGGEYTALVPRQRIGAMPYSVQSDVSIQAYAAFSADSATNATNATNAVNAENATLATTATTANTLAPNGANPNDYLKYDGNSWVASPLNINETQWTNNGSNIIYSEGRVGVNAATPLARFHVNSGNSEDALRVQVNGSTKLWVKQDGSTNVQGDLSLSNDAKQSSTKNGLVKYMVKFRCAQGIVATILDSYNGTTTDGDITINPGPGVGQCSLSFPTNVANRFIMTTVDSNQAEYNANCSATNTTLNCDVYNAATDSNGNFVLGIVAIVY
jgi:hypothetical protein